MIDGAGIVGEAVKKVKMVNDTSHVQVCGRYGKQRGDGSVLAVDRMDEAVDHGEMVEGRFERKERKFQRRYVVVGALVIMDHALWPGHG